MNPGPPPAHRVAALGLAAALLTACSVGDLPIVYKLDIQQGNVIDESMLARLEPGMERRKVRFLLGTPVLTDPFNEDRWDYVYTFQEGGGERVQRRVSLFFEGDRLARIEGDVAPGPAERPAEPRRERVVVVPPAEPEGLLERLKPGFLRRGREAETAGAEEAAGGEKTVATASPAAPARTAAPGEAEPEAEFFRRVLGRYRGEPDAGSRAPGESRGPASAEQGTPATQSAGTPQTAGADGAPTTASESESGFFRRLVERFRRERSGSDAPAPAGSAQGTPGGEAGDGR